MTTQQKLPEEQGPVTDVPHGRGSFFSRVGVRGALRFLLGTVVNAAILMVVLYLAGLLARSHTTASYFQGLADDWVSYVPMLLMFGACLTFWNRWLRRRHRERQAKQGDDSPDVPVD